MDMSQRLQLRTCNDKILLFSRLNDADLVPKICETMHTYKIDRQTDRQWKNVCISTIISLCDNINLIFLYCSSCPRCINYKMYFTCCSFYVFMFRSSLTVSTSNAFIKPTFFLPQISLSEVDLGFSFSLYCLDFCVLSWYLSILKHCYLYWNIYIYIY